MTEHIKLSNRLELNFLDLKDILLHNSEHIDGNFYIEVPKSRFLKILSDYWALNSIYIDGALEYYAENYRSYLLSHLNGKSNTYLIIKSKEEEKRGKCEDCNCDSKRWINPRTGKCYYNEMIENNYTTKINV